MTKEEYTTQITDAVTAVNDLVTQARADGITVDLTVISEGTMTLTSFVSAIVR